MPMQLMDILQKAFEYHASDIFLVGGLPVTFKVYGKMNKEGDKLLVDELESLIKDLYALSKREFKTQSERTDDDFSFSIPDMARFRCNVFYQRNTVGAVIRMLQFGIPNPSDFHITEDILDAANYNKGLVLVTGATGSGKSTTIACIIDKINQEQEKNIITMEDPIEFLHRHGKSIVIQREVPTDVPSFPIALRAALREAPDVLFVGEMRDPETIATAITAAETGHYVISTLHTMNAADTIDRVIDAFPPNQQSQIRFQLSRVLRCIVCQQLIPGVDGKLYPAFEIMVATPAIQNLIREGKTYQIPSIIQTGRSQGMRTMSASIEDLVFEHLVDKKVAMQYSDDNNKVIRIY